MVILSFSISFVCLVVILLNFSFIPLSDSVRAASPSDKELNPTYQEDAHFQALYLGIQFSLYLAPSLFGTQQQLSHPPVKSSSFPLWKNHVSQGLLFCNVLKLSCLGSLWFGTHPYYSLNLYVHLFYLWSTFIAKELFYFMFGLFL